MGGLLPTGNRRSDSNSARRGSRDWERFLEEEDTLKVPISDQ